MSNESDYSSSVYVGNVPFGTTDEDLAGLFEGFSLESCRMIKTRTGRSRGFAIVKFSDQDQANEAIEKVNECEFNGRKLFLKPDRRVRNVVELRDEDAVPTNVFITNIPYSATSRSLAETFGKEPGFQQAVIGTDGRTGRPRGYAVLSFDKAESAQAAIGKIDKSVLDGRVLSARIDYGPRGTRSGAQQPPASPNNPEND